MVNKLDCKFCLCYKVCKYKHDNRKTCKNYIPLTKLNDMYNEGYRQGSLSTFKAEVALEVIKRKCGVSKVEIK